ncbi:hypothetical protein QT06_C0001G0559 [archaeon GW2011_AR15]|nr:hypothetical protein QT06_C0001G0559 [archaeon GW2011_AR15]MBS3103870.1 DGQHR domain-containing protein [Candidatus Woesearchaeota archaeon]
MKQKYSANDELKTFAQNLGFKIFLFDDIITLGPEIKLREQSKSCEIDAILIYENLIILVGITKGDSTGTKKEINKFFERLDKVYYTKDMKLNLEINTSNKEAIKKNIIKANILYEELEKNIKEIEKNYEPKLTKLFFCPRHSLDELKLRDRSSSGEYIIDKDVNGYFIAVVDRLNTKVLFNDFMYFLNIKKVDLEKKSPSKTKKPGKTSPYSHVSRMELEKDKSIMYSFAVKVEEIVDFITVLRVSQKYNKKGFQRMIKKKRLDKINDGYLNENETFPNNVILTLNPKIYLNENEFYDRNENEFRFLDEFNSLYVIDGQHRIFSFIKGEKLDRPVLISLIFFKTGNDDEKALSMDRMFYEINKKQEKIDPNLSFILKARIDQDSNENFWYGVFDKLKEDILGNSYSFKETTIRDKEKKSIVSLITYGGVFALNDTKKKKGIELFGLKKFYSEEKQKNIEFVICFLNNYFKIIAKVLNKQNIDEKKLTVRDIGALLRLIKHFLLSKKEELKLLGEVKNIIKNEENKDLINYLEKILNYIPFKEVVMLEYGSSKWAAIEGYMLKKINDIDQRFGNKILLSKKGLEVYNQI